MRARLLLLATFALPGLLLAADPSPIFNGHDLSGWEHEGNRFTFGVRDGAIYTTGKGFQPNWLHTAREYEDFRLEFDFNLSQWTEAAVYVRAPRLGRQAESGIAITLAHDYHNGINSYTTGGIAGALPPKNPAKFGFDEWHHVEILAAGEVLKVLIDGIEKQNVELGTNAELRWRLRRGFIGFPDFGHAYRVKNIKLEDLGTRLHYIELVKNGSLDGWALRGAGNWSVHANTITGANGDGILYAPGEWQNFELTTLVRTHNHVNSGIFLRGSAEADKPRGFEIQIFNVPDSVYPTGSIYNISRSRIAADYDERWVLLQILLEDRKCQVRLNGDLVAESSNIPETQLNTGRIGLQIHSPDSSVEFRDLRIRSLP